MVKTSISDSSLPYSVSQYVFNTSSSQSISTNIQSQTWTKQIFSLFHHFLFLPLFSNNQLLNQLLIQPLKPYPQPTNIGNLPLTARSYIISPPAQTLHFIQSTTYYIASCTPHTKTTAKPKIKPNTFHLQPKLLIYNIWNQLSTYWCSLIEIYTYIHIQIDRYICI